MLSMIIADDEIIIREALAVCFDWEAMGIRIAAVCSNGVEALDAIIDESPDIVMTDIKMPGLNGLELIEKTQKIDSEIEYIILSGYKEFEFAKQAMKYGVRRYLLKPLDEEQLLDAVEDAKNNYMKRQKVHKIYAESKKMQNRLQEQDKQLFMHELFSIGNQLEDVITKYTEGKTPWENGYTTIYYSFLERTALQKFAGQIYRKIEDERIETIIDCLYVKNSLALLVQNKDSRTASWFQNIPSEQEEWRNLVCTNLVFKDLREALLSFSRKLLRYPVIWSINKKLDVVEIYNEGISPNKLNKLLESLLHMDTPGNQKDIWELLNSSLSAVENLDMLHGYAVNLLTHITFAKEVRVLSVVELLQVVDTIYQEKQPDAVIAILAKTFAQISFSSKAKNDSIINEVKKYVEAYLSDSNLSLKYIAQNHIHIHVDYLSRIFFRETGEKFSHFLNRRRIEVAMHLLEQDSSKIYQVAEQVGCGHNPRYFSQIFKKYTGMTPSAYIEQLQKSS